MHGWMTGLYLSLSQICIRPILYRILPLRVNQYLDVGHGFQVPLVVGGVGTWAVLKALGFFPAPVA